MSEQVRTEPPLFIDPDSITQPSDYPPSRPTNYPPRYDELSRDPSVMQLVDAKERARVEQGMGEMLEGVFTKHAAGVAVGKDGVERLRLRGRASEYSDVADLYLARRKAEDGTLTVTMLHTGINDWDVANVYTKAPGEWPRIEHGARVKKSVDVELADNRSDETYVADSFIRGKGELWFKALEHATLPEPTLRSKLATMALSALGLGASGSN